MARFSTPLLRIPLAGACLMVLALTGCGRGDDGPLEVAFIDSPADLYGTGIRLSAGAQHMRGATGAGLVSLDERGEVIPALADRWIVTEDGLSFIFRLRDGQWADGRPLTAESARTALRSAIKALNGTSLGQDLAAVSEVRAMAGRVVEIRLSTPVPMLMQLLAQPELALESGAGAQRGMGPMVMRREGDIAVLSMKPPQDRGEPEVQDWQSFVRQIRLHPAPAAAAIKLFDDGEVDVVLGGRLAALPLVSTGPLSRGTVRVEQVVGLFGLRVQRASGFLATRENREALAMALDRPALMAPFGLGGWTPTTRIVAPGLPDDSGLMGERWADAAPDALQAAAARRVASYGGPKRLVIAMGQSPGEDLLFSRLATQLAAVGLRLERVAPGDAADLAVLDQTARYAGAQWFLNQFSCSLRRGLCSSTADATLQQANATADRAQRAQLLARAEAELTAANVFIPIGAPVRFSLVRGDVSGFANNSWAWHPLPAMAVIPR